MWWSRRERLPMLEPTLMSAPTWKSRWTSRRTSRWMLVSWRTWVLRSTWWNWMSVSRRSWRNLGWRTLSRRWERRRLPGRTLPTVTEAQQTRRSQKSERQLPQRARPRGGPAPNRPMGGPLSTDLRRLAMPRCQRARRQSVTSNPHEGRGEHRRAGGRPVDHHLEGCSRLLPGGHRPFRPADPRGHRSSR